MTRDLYEIVLSRYLGELIDKDPKRAKLILTDDPEYLPDLYEIATVWGGPKDWPIQILMCDQMQMVLDEIDWSRGRSLQLGPSQLPGLDALTSEIPR